MGPGLIREILQPYIDVLEANNVSLSDPRIFTGAYDDAYDQTDWVIFVIAHIRHNELEPGLHIACNSQGDFYIYHDENTIHLETHALLMTPEKFMEFIEEKELI